MIARRLLFAHAIVTMLFSTAFLWLGFASEERGFFLAAAAGLAVTAVSLYGTTAVPGGSE